MTVAKRLRALLHSDINQSEIAGGLSAGIFLFLLANKQLPLFSNLRIFSQKVTVFVEKFKIPTLFAVCRKSTALYTKL